MIIIIICIQVACVKLRGDRNRGTYSPAPSPLDFTLNLYVTNSQLLSKDFLIHAPFAFLCEVYGQGT